MRQRLESIRTFLHLKLLPSRRESKEDKDFRMQKAERLSPLGHPEPNISSHKVFLKLVEMTQKKKVFKELFLLML